MSELDLQEALNDAAIHLEIEQREHEETKGYRQHEQKLREDAEKELAFVKSVLREIMQPTCSECACMMLGPQDPESTFAPHCEDCGHSDEADVRWDNTKADRLARIEEALK